MNHRHGGGRMRGMVRDADREAGGGVEMKEVGGWGEYTQKK